jgi:hypothetical protein
LRTFERLRGDLNVADFTAVVDWGDGTTSTLTAANQGITPRRPCCVVAAHTYRSSGRFTLAVQLFEKDGLAASTARDITVAPAPAPPPLPPGGFGAQSIMVGADGMGSVIDVGPSVAFAGPPPQQAAPAPAAPPASVAPRPPQPVTPAVAQTQMTDLVLQLGVAGGAGRANPAALLAADTINLAAQDLLLANLGKMLGAKGAASPETPVGEQPKD